MTFGNVRPLLLMGAVIVASASMAATSSAIAQQKVAPAQAADDCTLGTGNNCSEAFGGSQREGGSPSRPAAAQVTRQAASVEAYDAWRAAVTTQQTGLTQALNNAKEQALNGLTVACQAVSPHKPTDACP